MLLIGHGLDTLPKTMRTLRDGKQILRVFKSAWGAKWAPFCTIFFNNNKYNTNYFIILNAKKCPFGADLASTIEYHSLQFKTQPASIFGQIKLS